MSHHRAPLDTQEDDRSRIFDLFGTRTRFVVMVLVLLCLTSIWSNILAFNFALICMTPSHNETEAELQDHSDQHIFTSGQKSFFTSVVAIAALLGNIPVVLVVNRLGIRTIFTALGILSALGTLLMPTAIRKGVGFILACRAMQGLAFAGNYVVIGVFCASWTYHKQTGLFVSVLVAYVQVAPAITMPVSGELCEHSGWSSIFYGHGAATLVLFILYDMFYRNTPHKHPFVGYDEQRKIATGKPGHHNTHLRSIPYLAILKTPAVWGIWIAAAGSFVAVNLMFLYGPLYLSGALGFSSHKTGFTAALPPLAQFVAKVACGAISDRIKSLSEVTKFRVFNSLAFFGSAMCFLLLAYMSAETKTLDMILLGGAAGFLGAATGGFFKAAPFLSRQYSHFVTGNFTNQLTGTMLIVPFLVNSLAPYNTQEQWRGVFIIVAAVLIVSNLVFCLLIEGEPADWTRESPSLSTRNLAQAWPTLAYPAGLSYGRY